MRDEGSTGSRVSLPRSQVITWTPQGHVTWGSHVTHESQAPICKVDKMFSLHNMGTLALLPTCQWWYFDGFFVCLDFLAGGEGCLRQSHATQADSKLHIKVKMLP